MKIQTYSSHVLAAEFCRWSLQLPEMNEVTQKMLFVRVLPDCTQREVLRDHPRSISEAISGVRAALRYSSTNGNQRRSGFDRARLSHKTVNEATSFSAGDDSSSRLKKLTQKERGRLLCEGKCFTCRKAGHLARSCPASNTRFKLENPNAEVQRLGEYLRHGRRKEGK